MDIPAIKAEIAAAARSLEHEITALNSCLRENARGWPAAVYSLPGYNAHEAAEYITVERQLGEAAQQAGMAMFAAIDYAPDQHPTTVRRMPGVICAPPDVEPAVAAVNDAKTQLKQAVQKLPRGRWQRERGSMKRAATLCLLQAYRGIRVLGLGTHRVSFTWDGKGASGRQVTVAEARKMLEEPGYYGAVSDARQAIERKALRDLRADEILLQRKPIAPTPAANAWLSPGARPTAFRVEMPLIVLCESHDATMRINDLKDFDLAERERKQRSDRHVADEPLVERLYLYRYLEAWRRYDSPERAAS